MRIPVFHAMFYGAMAQSDGGAHDKPIALPDLTPTSFKDLLKHIYTESLDLQSMDQAMGLYYAAQKYILPDLVAKCKQYMKNNLCTAYACRVLKFTKLCDDDDLKTECYLLLRKHTKVVLISPDFDKLSPSTVLSIVKEEVLDISKLELFDAIIRWAGYQCAQRDLEINGTNMRQMMSEVIYEIRFLTMTTKEFASTPALSEILTKDECFAVFVNLNNPGSMPLPQHFSSSRTKTASFSQKWFSGIMP